MHWTGLILLDCWGGAWHDRCAKSQQFYQRILDFLREHEITVYIVVEAAYPISGDFGPDPVFRSIPRRQTRSDILDWQQFCDAGFNHGAWLLAGQSWNQCIHQRKLGVISYADSDRLKFQLYSHADLLDTAPEQQQSISDHDFQNDQRVKWQSRPRGFWRVQHQRILTKPLF
jgi:hypothetical protein